MYCNCTLPQHMFEFTYIYMLQDPNWDAWSNNLICSPILAQTARVISATGWLSSTITVFLAPSSVCTRRALCLVRYSTTLWREGGRGKRESEICAHRSVLYVCVHARMVCVCGGGGGGGGHAKCVNMCIHVHGHVCFVHCTPLPTHTHTQHPLSLPSLTPDLRL